MLWEEGWDGNAEGAITFPIHIFPSHFGPGSLGVVRKFLCISSVPQRLQGFLEPWVSSGVLEAFEGVVLCGRACSRLLMDPGLEMPAMVLVEVDGRWPSDWGYGAGAAPSQARDTFLSRLLLIHRGSPLLLGRRGSFGLL